MLEAENSLTFGGVDYVIRQSNETTAGTRSIKKVEAVERFFVDMIDAPQPRIHNGSITFFNVMAFIFENTDYTFNIVDQFTAERFENFGRTNALALFNTALERYGAEYDVVGKVVTLRRSKGARTDFAFRYGVNVKVLDKQTDSNDISTAIRGYGGEPDDDGNYPINETYISPHADKYKTLRWAEPVVNKNLSTVAGMQARLKRVLIDEPQLSVTIDFADLRASGYTADVPNEGDWGYIIYEPMDDFIAEARIAEINEEFDANGRAIKTTVTLSNIRRKLTDVMTQFSNTSKAVNQLLTGQRKIPFAALDNAIINATRALQSAQTELKFENGIIAVDKTNANNLVLFNSAGVGISNDGGRTFRTAMTGDGFVADVITTGTLMGINISGVNFMGDDMQLRNQLHLMNEYSGVVGTYDYGPEMVGDTYNPRHFTGSYRLGTNHLRFLADAYNVNANGSKGSHRGFTATYYGSDYIKMRNYPNSENLAIRSRVDISADMFQIARTWNDVDEGVILKSDGSVTASTVEARGFLKAGRELDVVGQIIGRSTLDIEGSALFRSTVDFQGSAVFRSNFDVQGQSLLRSTLDVRGGALFGNDVDVTGQLLVDSNVDVGGGAVFRSDAEVKGRGTFGSSVGITGALVAGSTLDVTGASVFRSTLDFGGSSIFRSTIDAQGSSIFRSLVDIRGELRSSAVYNKTSSVSANVYVDTNGTVGRATSARKYKHDIKDVVTDGYAEKLLTLKPKSWIDKAEMGAGMTELRRYFGLIAEDVFDAGLGAYVTYDNDMKEIEGIMYDRLWTLMIPIVKRMDERIKELERRGLINGTIRIG